MIDGLIFESFHVGQEMGFGSSDAVHPAECRYAYVQPSVRNYWGNTHLLIKASSIVLPASTERHAIPGNGLLGGRNFRDALRTSGNGP
jgi:hypothetical protein